MQSSIFFYFLFGLMNLLLINTSIASENSNLRILIMGDSLSAAHNIAIQHSWPVLFEQKIQQINPNNRVVNASISGETSLGGKSRLEDLLQKHRPSHLILELGGNDGLRGYKFRETQENLIAMVDMALAREIKVLLIGVRLPPNLGPVYNQRFQKIFESIAGQRDIAYLPRFLQGVAADKPEYMQSDGIHPTALAQPILAERVFNKIKNIWLTQ